MNTKAEIYLNGTRNIAVSLNQMEFDIVLNKLNNAREYKETDQFFNFGTSYKPKVNPSKANVFILDEASNSFLDLYLIYGGSTKVVDCRLRPNRRGKKDKSYFFYILIEKTLKFLLRKDTEVIKINTIFNKDEPRLLDERSISKLLSLSHVKNVGDRELFLSAFYHFLYKENLRELIVIASVHESEVSIDDELFNHFCIYDDTARKLAGTSKFENIKTLSLNENDKEELEKFNIKL